jgi:hypothetical protein
MSHRTKAATVVLALLLAACDSAATTRHEETALAAADQWLAQNDGGDYAGAYDVAAPNFKVAIQKEVWESRQAALYRQLGTPDRRELIAVKYTSSLPGVGQGDHVAVQYLRNVAWASPVFEILVMQGGPEVWRTATYNILPSEP